MTSTVRGRSEETLYESLSYQELHQRSSKGWKEQAGIVMMTLLTMMLVLIICNNIFSVQMLFVSLGLIRPLRWLAKRRKKKEWLGNFWKFCIFVPPTPGFQLKKLMQKKEEEMRAGGRETIPIKIIETAGRTLEETLVNNDPFDGNQCTDAKCEPRKNPKNKIYCRRN